MKYLCITSPGSGGKTTAACVTLAHFLSAEIRKQLNVKPKVLVLAPGDYAARIVSRGLESLVEASGYASGDEDRGSYVMDTFTYGTLPERIETEYKFVLADDISQDFMDGFIRRNRIALKGASVIHTVSSRRQVNVTA